MCYDLASVATLRSTLNHLSSKNMGRKIKYKPNEFIKPCPKCCNNTEFTVHSEQVAEDGCEIWAVCKCGYNPTSYENAGSGYRVEDVWGGTSDDQCQDAIRFSWNDPIEEFKEAPIAIHRTTERRQ